MRLFPFIVVGIFCAPNASAQATLRAQRASSHITIDGNLSEQPWQEADVARNFRQIDPAEGEPATERTEVRVLYDNGSIYVGARLYDSEPGKIVTRLSRRDDYADGDRFTFYVDAMHDHLTGALFEVSAGGVQRDAAISNDTNQDGSWDAVWVSAVSEDAEGWTVEMRIPLSQLRSLSGDRQIWGFNASRFIYRKNETDWFELVPKKENGLASRMATLTDIDGIQPRRTLEITSYGATRSEYIRPQVTPNPFNDGSRYFSASGFDLKYALRPNVILNATVNPDFGQVEIDPAVVNLGAFETFYPEKRPFFTEGSQIFDNFGNLGANERDGFNRDEPVLIHGRRIGRPPQGSASGDFVDMPSGTSILGAAKITGKTTRGWSFGVLEALTSREFARVSNSGQISRQEVEPETNYFAGRLLKEFGDGRYGVGALFTSVNRDLRDAALKDLLVGRGNVAGLDGYYFLDRNRNWVVNGRFVASEVAGSTAAIERLQLEPQRYFQRPDSPEIHFDPQRTSLRGWNGDVNLNRQSGGVTVNAALWAVSPGWESNDLGFHFNGDSWGNHVAVDWKQLKPDRFTRFRDIKVAKFYVWDYANVRLSDGVMSFGNVTFNNYWGAGGAVGFFRRAQNDRLTRGGPPAVDLPSQFANLYLNTDSRKRIVFHLNGGRGWNADGGGSADGSVSVEWKPSSQLNFSSGPSYSHNITAAQYVTTLDDPAAIATFGKRYIFARLQQSQLSVDTRVNVLFSPKTSLQVYMQPLVAVGNYLDFKSLAVPWTFPSESYNSPLTYDPDFNFKSLRVNAVFRWEWRLGSTLYVAWTQQRQDLSDPGVFQAGRDLGRVFMGPANNIVMAKITYWLAR